MYTKQIEGYTELRQPTSALIVLKSGTGTGTVISSEQTPLINCSNDCVEDYLTDTTVTLTAEKNDGSIFTGWSGGGCSGTGTCTVKMDQAKAVTATFIKQQYTLTVLKAGTGTGTVMSSEQPCGLNCNKDYDLDSTLAILDGVKRW